MQQLISSSMHLKNVLGKGPDGRLYIIYLVKGKHLQDNKDMNIWPKLGCKYYTTRNTDCAKTFKKSYPYLLGYVKSLAIRFRMEPQAAEGFSKNWIVRFLQTLEGKIKKILNKHMQLFILEESRLKQFC